MTSHHADHDQRTHGHGAHDHHTDVDWSALLPLLEQNAELQAPLYREAGQWLTGLLPAGGVRRVLDVGSGPGVVSCLLAETFRYAEVVAVDGAAELLAAAERRAAAQNARVTTLRADLPAQLATLGEADLLWAGNSLHHLGDQGSALAGFAERLRPGGILAIVEGGLPQRFLPRNTGIGRPGLEQRLEALHAEWFARMRADLPGAEDVVDDWRALLTEAGLTPSGSRTFLHDAPAPVTDAVRAYAVAQFTRYRDGFGDALDAGDRTALDRLLDPAEPLGLHRRTDLYWLTAHTVHTARKG
ncbi:SAM-dependent methyltransferase [Streptomyces solincola]|uniref:SAM-dependent methyltransferase n=1 Tax=Streptomyces solincola TaxID=2100817 RepID=A0A2S9PWX1_9ACTN|nr:class I SAM-dependent methyltransferase [Streptomyces solincola]PRH78905.1 SAM-dependent methyltransferase [Streptomyces solincola]